MTILQKLAQFLQAVVITNIGGDAAAQVGTNGLEVDVKATTGLTNNELRSDPVAVSLVDMHLGEEVVAGNNKSQMITVPAGTTMIQVNARGGVVYCTVNGNASPTTSGYYVPENGVRLIGPFDNITTLGVWAAADDFAHLVYQGRHA